MGIFVPLENSYDLKYLISAKKALSALSIRLTISVFQSWLLVIVTSKYLKLWVSLTGSKNMIL